MADRFGSDFITIEDEDGAEFELEVLSELEYNGCLYYAVCLAGDRGEDGPPEISILKNTEENGEPILEAIQDEQELEAVNQLMMDALYEDEDTSF